MPIKSSLNVERPDYDKCGHKNPQLFPGVFSVLTRNVLRLLNSIYNMAAKIRVYSARNAPAPVLRHLISKLETVLLNRA